VQSSFQNLYVLDYHYFVKLLIFCQGIVYDSGKTIIFRAKAKFFGQKPAA